ncbi:hypothetical protein EDD18DRAFT_239742 [Armillaria luteobubalina]|uniref:F-box domain-containing protein n=1 Tax=Armillaria luteobubalina TaxID=153913 RepID=A0AA39NYY9_9AGAR|nr:hypothetical protein EDD18DRAFT_239742 [Armillaria luteobubalina]
MSSIPPDFPPTCPTCGSRTETTFYDHPRSSRISELLKCNDPPSNGELSDFQSIVKSGPGHIADLDKKIARAKQHLAALIQERNVLEANICDARTLSSPIRRLPSDVLRGIALATIPSRYRLMNFPIACPGISNSLDSKESPWTLAQVSHRWRSIIVSAPEVWSSMALVIKRDEGPVAVAHQMFMAGLRLERSKLLPLTLSVSISPKADVSNHPLLLLISTRSSLVRNLRIEASLISYPAFSWWRGRLDQLYRLTLRDRSRFGREPESSGSIKSVIDAFEYAPELKMITVENFHSSSFHFPGTQITNLTLIGTIGWEDVQNFRQFQNLIHLHVMYPESGLSVPADHRAIPLPALTSLTLTYVYHMPNPPPASLHGSDLIFSLISMPNLTRLQLTYYSGFIVCPSIPMPNAITALRIGLDGRCDSMPSSGLSVLLKSVPNLHELVISPSSMFPFPYDASRLVELLMDIPLYHLRTLDLRGSWFQERRRPTRSCMHKFVEIVEAHTQGNIGEIDKIETVYLRCPLTLDPVYTRRWRSLIDRGLKLVYGHPEPY